MLIYKAHSFSYKKKMVNLQSVSYTFGTQWALKNISLDVNEGEFIFLTGHSGAGKTTLMRLLYGALALERGRGSVCGYQLHNLKKSHIPLLRRDIGVVFQDFKILPDHTVFENIALPLDVLGMPKEKKAARINSLVRTLGIEKKILSKCGNISGGEQQRVAIARACVTNPRLILADEPTGNLDPDLTVHLMNVFKQFNMHGTTVIMATHSVDVLKAVPNARILQLDEGILQDSYTLDKNKNLQREQTSSLIEDED